MTLSAQRGAIPLELDRPRILFYSAASTWLLVERYGVGFAGELYTVEATGGANTSLRLKSVEALQYFLWAGLQDDARQHGETVTLDQVGEFIRPWLLPLIFRTLMQALTGALYVTPVKVGNEAAAEAPASPTAKTKAKPRKPKKKASTLKTPSGLRLQR